MWSLKRERWGSPLFQEKYQEEKACYKRHSYRIIIIIKSYGPNILLLLLPLELQPTVGFGLLNNVLPFFSICHQHSPSSHSQHLKNMDIIYPRFWQHCLLMLKLLSKFRFSLQRLYKFRNSRTAYTENRNFTHNKMVRKSQCNRQLGKRRNKLAWRYNSKM